MKKFFKAWFYRKGRFFPPYMYISLFLGGGLTMLAFRLIPFFQNELKISDTLLLTLLGFVMTWVTIWSRVVTKDVQLDYKGEERRNE